jgi:hypothetical protein
MQHAIQYLLAFPAMNASRPQRGDVSDGSGHHTKTHYTLRFYLDETHAQLMGEGADGPSGPTNLNVKTESYSDTQIMGGISTEVNDMWFYRPTDGHTALLIQRQTGTAIVTVKLLPKGAEVTMGPCHEVAAPPTKF